MLWRSPLRTHKFRQQLAPQCELKAGRRTLNRSEQRADTPINCRPMLADLPPASLLPAANRILRSHVARAWLAISLTIYSLPTDSVIRSLWRALNAFVKRRT